MTSSTSPPTSSPPSSPSCCGECHRSFGCMATPTKCHKCETLLCSRCSGQYPLIPYNNNDDDDNNNNNNNNDDTLNKDTVIESYCKSCFQDTSVLDFTRTYDVIVGTKSTGTATMTPTTTTFLMVHGGGGSRAMFRPHARLLVEKRPEYRCVLIDLPGHGTLVNTPLTLDNCVETVRSVMIKENLSPNETIYVGGSLGAYVGFYVLYKLQKDHQMTLAGAILMDCGQNVGPGCSFKANVGLWFLNLLGKNMSNMALMKAMFGVAIKSKANWKLLESSFGAGMFFNSAPQQVACLRGVAPAQYIPTLSLPILYFNGSEDYRDSEDLWLRLCHDQDRSYLKVYEGGDHFFSHDERFVDDLIERMDAFAADLCGDGGGGTGTGHLKEDE